MFAFLLLTSCDADNTYQIPWKLFYVPSNGMFPTLTTNDKFLAVRKPLVNEGDLQRGDIVLYKNLHKGKEYTFVWRLVGLPGDTVITNNTSLFVNDVELKHTKIKEDEEYNYIQEEHGTSSYILVYKKQPDPKRRPNMTIQVPDGHMFLMGDNRDGAYDNRYTGTVELTNMIGKKVKW